MAVEDGCVLFDWTESTMAKLVSLNRTFVLDSVICVWQTIYALALGIFLIDRRSLFRALLCFIGAIWAEVVKSFKEQQATAQKATIPGAIGFSRTSRPARTLTSRPRRIRIVPLMLTLWLLRVFLTLKILLLGHRKQRMYHDESVNQSETLRFKAALKTASCWLPLA